MQNNLVNNLSPSIMWRLRYVEWLFLATHLILAISIRDSDDSLLLDLAVYGIFLVFSWMLPINRSLKWRGVYISLAMLLIVGANFLGISLDLLLYLYIAKSFFLIGKKNTIGITILTGIGWVASECYAEMQQLKQSNTIRFEPPFGVGDYSPQSIFVFALGLYIAVSIFTIFFSSVIVAEYKSRKRAEALTEQVKTLAINLERTRIARDIHDSLGHTLTNLDIQLKLARKLRDRDLDKTWEAIDQASLLSAQCIEDVSHAVQTMRRSDFNLDRALSNLVEQIRNNRNLDIQWNFNLPQLSLSTSHQIYCVVKEGLINIQKHSKASRVMFQGYFTNTEIVLKLEDNGVGFDPQQVNSGCGLKGIVERIQVIKGKLEVETSPGKGTQILVTIPR
jgi:signal transduction histidine kinase